MKDTTRYFQVTCWRAWCIARYCFNRMHLTNLASLHLIANITHLGTKASWQKWFTFRWYEGLVLYLLKATSKTRPRSLARLMTRIDDLIVMASGFSHNTCLFASSALIHSSSWVSVGVPMITPSMLVSLKTVSNSSNPSTVHLNPYFSFIASAWDLIASHK